MIMPIRDLKNTTEISKLCHEKDEPIFITKNGYDDLVIMSIEVYEGNVKKDYVNYSTSPKEKEYMVSDSMTLYGSTPKYTIPVIKQILDPILKRSEVYSAVLFGSYAKGTDHSNSDIDLVVDCNLKGLEFYGLLEEISNAFSVPVDLIARYQIQKGSPIEKEIKETGIRIYEN